MKKYKPVDLAYTAGVIDSDGCIRISRYRTKYFTPWIEIAQRDTESLRYIKNLFNFTVYSNMINVKNKLFKRLLIVIHKNCKKILKLLLPYLKIKRKQALIVLKFCDLIEAKYKTKKGKGKDTRKLSNVEIKMRQKLYEKSRKLNGRHNENQN